MCSKYFSNSRNSDPDAKPRSANSEFQKSASRGSLSLRIEQPSNRTGSPQSRTGRHQSQLNMSRCFSESLTSTPSSSGNMRWWLFHLQNDQRRQWRLASHQMADLDARSQRTVGNSNGNGQGKPNRHSGNSKGLSPSHQSCSISTRPRWSSSKRTRVDLR